MSDTPASIPPAPSPLPVAAVAPKSGWFTSEHVLCLVAAVLTALYASGAIPAVGPAAQIAGIVGTVLTALGYTVSRTLIKTAAAKS